MYASALTDPDGFGSALAIEVERLEDEHHGRMHAYAELCVPEAGVLRPSMMITWADVLCGSLANVYALPRITMTVDLDVRVVRPVPAGSDLVPGVHSPAQYFQEEQSRQYYLLALELLGALQALYPEIAAWGIGLPDAL